MSFLAFGNHTVRHILRSTFFTIKKILLREEHKKDKELLKELKKKNTFYEFVTKERFSRYGFDKKNQGIVIFISNYNYVSFSSLFSSQPQQKYPCLIILDSIEDPHNFGTILRIAAALAIDGIIISKKNQVPVNNTVIKISMGGVAYVPVCRVNSLLQAVNELKKRKYKIVSAVCDPKARKHDELNFNFPVCLIFGNEHKGVRLSLIRESDYLIYIPMNNSMLSLNVSVSCGIICAQMISRRRGDIVSKHLFLN